MRFYLKYLVSVLLLALAFQVVGQSAMGITRPKKTTKKEMQDFFDFKTRTNVKTSTKTDFFTSPRRASSSASMGDYFTKKRQRHSNSGSSGNNLSISRTRSSNGRMGDYFSNGSAKKGSGQAKGGDLFSRKKKKKYIPREPENGLLPKKMYWYKPKKRDKGTPIKRKEGDAERDSE